MGPVDYRLLTKGCSTEHKEYVTAMRLWWYGYSASVSLVLHAISASPSGEAAVEQKGPSDFASRKIQPADVH